MLTYEPFIQLFENYNGANTYAALNQFAKESKERFGKEDVCMGGVEGLEVVTVSEPFFLIEYDGYERVAWFERMKRIDMAKAGEALVSQDSLLDHKS